MFLPIGDSPNPLGTPWLNYSLIGLNVVVFLGLYPLSRQGADLNDPRVREYVATIAEERQLSRPQVQDLLRQVSRYDLVVFEHGFKPARPQALDLLTAMFLHGGWMHLLGNMLFLWIYGDNVELRLGRWRYLLAYLGTGVAAGLGDALLRLDSSIPSVGASGAISGVLGLYFIWFPKNRVRVWLFLFPFIAEVVELPARLVLGIYLLFDNLLPLLLTTGGGISYGAHIGGFAAGFGLAALVNRWSLTHPERDLRRHRGPASPVDVFRAACAGGEWLAAARWFFDAPPALTRRSIEAREKIELAEALERLDHPRAALSAYQRALADHPRGPGRARAHVGAARVMMNDLGYPAAAYQHLYAALEEDATPADAAAARALLDQLATRVRSVPRRYRN